MLDEFISKKMKVLDVNALSRKQQSELKKLKVEFKKQLGKLIDAKAPKKTKRHISTKQHNQLKARGEAVKAVMKATESKSLPEASSMIKTIQERYNIPLEKIPAWAKQHLRP